MTGPNDTLDDEAYDALIAELGLDLDLDLKLARLLGVRAAVRTQDGEVSVEVGAEEHVLCHHEAWNVGTAGGAQGA